jgi:hypothetical protein
MGLLPEPSVSTCHWREKEETDTYIFWSVPAWGPPPSLNPKKYLKTPLTIPNLMENFSTVLYSLLAHIPIDT